MRSNHQLSTHIRNEYTQIYIRVGAVALALFGLIFQEAINPEIASTNPFFCILIYFICIAGYLAWLKIKPHRSMAMRVFLFMSIDILTTITIMYFAGPLSALFVGFLLWYIVGFGMRFGVRYAAICTVFTIVSWVIFSFASPYWNSRPYHTYGWLIVFIIIPLYYFLLVKRLHTTLDELNSALRKTEKLANYDCLTNLINRHHFNETVEAMLAEGQQLTLFMLDLDGFKSINDQYGHYVGDQVLIDIANLLKHCLAEFGPVCRLGGDEFIAALPDCDPSRAAQFSDIILASMGNATQDYERVSASIGICFCPGDSDSFSQAKGYADTAMYAAKKQGKNCYRFYSDLETLSHI